MDLNVGRDLVADVDAPFAGRLALFPQFVECPAKITSASDRDPTADLG
jgi:hypothetical protein